MREGITNRLSVTKAQVDAIQVKEPRQLVLAFEEGMAHDVI
mgnify:CR=1 FL=1